MIKSTTTIKVRYAEVDKMGFVYCSRYLEYFEISRADWLEKNMIAYSNIEDDYGIYLPVVDSNIKNKKPAKYDNKLLLVCNVDLEAIKKSICFNYEIYFEEQLICTGNSTHLFLDRVTNKVITIPQELSKLLHLDAASI
jgi:acyl-CoA thioester hydrolase